MEYWKIQGDNFCPFKYCNFFKWINEARWGSSSLGSQSLLANCDIVTAEDILNVKWFLIKNKREQKWTHESYPPAKYSHSQQYRNHQKTKEWTFMTDFLLIILNKIFNRNLSILSMRQCPKSLIISNQNSIFCSCQDFYKRIWKSGVLEFCPPTFYYNMTK